MRKETKCMKEVFDSLEFEIVSFTLEDIVATSVGEGQENIGG